MGRLSSNTRREESLAALSVLLCLDVIRPSYQWLRAAGLKSTYRIVRELRDPQFTKQVDQHAHEHRHPRALVNNALVVISKIMLHTGKHIAEITPDDVVEYYRVAVQLRGRGGAAEYAWDLLATFGGFPDATLPLRDFVRTGPMTAAEMVDIYPVQCEPIREVLVRYLAERAAALDHSSLRGLAYKLVGSFWQDLERHHPGIATLDLPDEVATAWKTRLRARQADPWPNFIAVRAFYLDIAHWATYDAYWAGWSARCPVSITDTRGQAKYSQRVRARLHQKIRCLTPRLPELLRSVDEQLAFHTGLLAAAKATQPGSCCTYRGKDYEHQQLRSSLKRSSGGRSRAGSYCGTGRVWLTDLASGERIDLTRQEDLAFWAWAGINTFYYTGMFSRGQPAIGVPA